MEKIKIWLPGQPARVTHQSGTRYSRHGTHKSKALQAWEAELMDKLADYVPAAPLEGPIRLHVCFGYSTKRKKDLGNWKLTRPDTDNAIKTLKDIMTRLQFWHDDAQVAHEVCMKIWTKNPGISIKVEQMSLSATEGEEANVQS